MKPNHRYRYQNHTLDSTYWDDYQPREDDIVIATSLKAGTTWMQNIVAGLVFQGVEMPKKVWQMSPWLEARTAEFEQKIAGLEEQKHRRFIKTHLPLDGLPYFPQVKYIYVGRSGLDIFMSLWNHHRALKPEMLAEINALPGRVGDPFPIGAEDIHVFFKDWITKGWFEWEREGYPYWSVLHHAQSWFDFRHLDNILLVHFHDLLADLDGEMRRIAGYLEIDVQEGGWDALVDSLSFKSMKKRAEEVVPGGGDSFKGGARQFLKKGTNGRWQGVLTREEVAKYEKTVAEYLTPDCARWLAAGRHAAEVEA